MSDVDIPKHVLIIGDNAVGVTATLREMKPYWSFEHNATASSVTPRVIDLSLLDAIVTLHGEPDQLSFAGAVAPRVARISIATAEGGPSQRRPASHIELSSSASALDLSLAVERATAVQMRIHDPALLALVDRIDSLPSPSSFLIELEALLREPEVDVRRIARHLETDVSMTTRMLQLVNSAAFGLSHRITDVERAIAFAGLRTVTNLATATSLLDAFVHDSPDVVSEISALNEHSSNVARLAKASCSEGEGGHEAFTAGILHDIGLLALLANSPDSYWAIRSEVMSGQFNLEAIELDVIGTTHAALGAWLLDCWEFPWSLVEAVSFSHSNSLSLNASSEATRAVYLAETSAAINSDKVMWWEPADGSDVESEMSY